MPVSSRILPDVKLSRPRDMETRRLRRRRPGPDCRRACMPMEGKQASKCRACISLVCTAEFRGGRFGVSVLRVYPNHISLEVCCGDHNHSLDKDPSLCSFSVCLSVCLSPCFNATPHAPSPQIHTPNPMIRPTSKQTSPSSSRQSRCRKSRECVMRCMHRKGIHQRAKGKKNTKRKTPSYPPPTQFH